MSAATLVPFVDSLSGVNLGYRTSGGIPLNARDLMLFFIAEDQPRVETTAYAGVFACILALAGIWAIFGKNSTGLRLFAFFNALLVLITISLAFGFLPHRFIEALPVFRNNPGWGRLIVVTLLALASLSAIGMDFGAVKLEVLSGRYLGLTPLNAKRLIVLAMIGTTAVQFQSQKDLFNRFNAVVPSAWFYPLTPSVKYVKDHLKPLQSVIADNSYWFAGTLGAYGIPEWYAHSFRTDREKEVLSELVHNPFLSPTSSLINFTDIQFNSPLMDKLAIRYLLVSKGRHWSKRQLQLPEVSRDQALPLPSGSWRQHIYIPYDMVVESIGFLFSTYGEGRAPGKLRLSIYNERGQKLSFDPLLAGSEISDNQWGIFKFPNNIYFVKGGYFLILSYVDYAEPYKLTAWTTKNQGNRDSYLEVSGRRTDTSLIWKIDYFEKIDPTVFAGRWNPIDMEKDIVIFENKKVTNSAYFVKDLDASHNDLDFSGLDFKQVSVGRIEIANAHRDAGWIVLPMRLYPGWRAYIDNRQVGYDAYMGMLPAIPVQGVSHIVFEYRSESFRRGLTVSLVGVFIFFLFLGYCYRKGKK